MNTNIVKRVMAVAVVAPLATAGVVLAGGSASAAVPPSVSVTLAGTSDWSLTWDGTPAAGCQANLGGTVFPAGPSGSALIGSLLPAAPGAYSVVLDCAGSKSAAITVYTPRNAVNDMRTQFSNTTQGMFGS